MSILSSLSHHEIHDKPNNVHNTPRGPLAPLCGAPVQSAAARGAGLSPGLDPAGENGAAGPLSDTARRHMDALREGHLRPVLYYSQQEQTSCKRGAWENPHTVASKLEAREEYPRG